MTRLVLLHTAESNVERFERLVQEARPGVTAVHVCRPELLDRARVAGPEDPGVVAELRDLIGRSAAPGDVVLCTCSTLGGVAVTAAPPDVTVLRVDAAMADELCRFTGGIERERPGRAGGGPTRVGVVVALESTVEPTLSLLGDTLDRAGRHAELLVVRCHDAWEDFEAGRMDGYLVGVADAARLAVAEHRLDAIVLAQGSMLDAADSLADLGVPVLASPRLGVLAALAAFDG